MAWYWYRRATKQGDGCAQADLDEMLNDMRYEVRGWLGALLLIGLIWAAVVTFGNIGIG